MMECDEVQRTFSRSIDLPSLYKESRTLFRTPALINCINKYISIPTITSTPWPNLTTTTSALHPTARCRNSDASSAADHTTPRTVPADSAHPSAPEQWAEMPRKECAKRKTQRWREKITRPAARTPRPRIRWKSPPCSINCSLQPQY